MSIKKDTITRILHWVFACFVIIMISLGFYMTNTEYSSNLYGWHKTLGVIFTMVIGIRLYWRIKHPWKSSTVLNKNDMTARSLIHCLLIILFLAMPLSGLLSSTYSGWGVHIFDIFIVPKNLNQIGEVTPINDFIYKTAKASHRILAYFFTALIFLHIIAVLKHHFINKDNTLINMLKNKS